MPSKQDVKQRHAKVAELRESLNQVMVRPDDVPQLTAEERKEWQQKRHKAHKVVEKKLRSDAETLSEQTILRSFNVNYHVCLIHHTKNTVQRKMVIMRDMRVAPATERRSGTALWRRAGCARLA